MSNLYGNELYHFGVKGQKWGERQYQYEDGSLTPEGRIHYGYDRLKNNITQKKSNIKQNIKSEKSNNQIKKFETYKKGDKDFDDKNYTEDNRIGTTDFFSFKNSNGDLILLKEDQKWTLPGNTDANTLKKNLQSFNDILESNFNKYGLGTYTGEDWLNAATAYINGDSAKGEKILQEALNKSGLKPLTENEKEDLDKSAVIKDGKILDQDLLDQYVKKVIRGDYGNGADRVKALGNKYDQIQTEVNKVLREARHSLNISNGKAFIDENKSLII